MRTARRVKYIYCHAASRISTRICTQQRHRQNITKLLSHTKHDQYLYMKSLRSRHFISLQGQCMHSYTKLHQPNYTDSLLSLVFHETLIDKTSNIQTGAAHDRLKVRPFIEIKWQKRARTHSLCTARRKNKEEEKKLKRQNTKLCYFLFN